MLYLLKASFHDGVEAQREAEHEKFGQHLAQRFPRVRLGGALCDDAGRRSGVALIVEAHNRAEIDAFLQSSPYMRANLYRSVEVDVLELEVGSLG